MKRKLTWTDGSKTKKSLPFLANMSKTGANTAADNVSRRHTVLSLGTVLLGRNNAKTLFN